MRRRERYPLYACQYTNSFINLSELKLTTEDAIIAASTKRVKRTRLTERQLNKAQRKIRQKISRQHRRRNPSAPKRPKFPHKSARRHHVLYNLFAKVRYAQFGPKRYLSTLNAIRNRLSAFLGLKVYLSTKTVRRMIQALVDGGLITAEYKLGLWVIDILPGAHPTPAQFRKAYFQSRDSGACCQICPGGAGVTPYIYELIRNKINTTSNTSYNTIQGQGDVMIDFATGSRAEILSAEHAYRDFRKSDPQAARKIGINTYRKERGMELLPEDKPIGIKKTESQMDRRRDWVQTNTNVAPIVETFKTKSKEVLETEMKNYHTEENEDKAKNAFSALSKLLGYKRA